MRTFIAAEINNEMKEKIDSFIFKTYKELGNNNIKWVKKDNLHITVKFLGETEPELIKPIEEKIYKAISNIESFNIELRTIGVFPDTKFPKVLWIGITTGEPELTKIFNLIEKSLVELNIKPETKKFQPHLTIARIKKITNVQKIKSYLQKYQNVDFGRCQIKYITFFESILHHEGPEYKLLSKFSLYE